MSISFRKHHKDEIIIEPTRYQIKQFFWDQEESLKQMKLYPKKWCESFCMLWIYIKIAFPFLFIIFVVLAIIFQFLVSIIEEGVNKPSNIIHASIIGICSPILIISLIWVVLTSPGYLPSNSDWDLNEEMFEELIEE